MICFFRADTAHIRVFLPLRLPSEAKIVDLATPGIQQDQIIPSAEQIFIHFPSKNHFSIFKKIQLLKN